MILPNFYHDKGGWFREDNFQEQNSVFLDWRQYQDYTRLKWDKMTSEEGITNH